MRSCNTSTFRLVCPTIRCHRQATVRAACILVLLTSHAAGLGSPADKAAVKPPQSATPADAPAGWWSKVQDDIRQFEYHVTWQKSTALAGPNAAYQAPNRAHNLRTYFTPDGIRVVPRIQNAPAWEWGLKLTGHGRGWAVRPPTAAEPTTNGNRVEYQRGDLTEWYINDQRGLEQGFTIDQCWAEGATDDVETMAQLFSPNELRIELAVTGNLRGQLSHDGQSVDFLTIDGIRAIHFGELRVTDARGRSLPARFEMQDARLAFVVDDAGAVYPVTVDPLATSPNWTVDGGQSGSDFSASVSTAGDVNGDGYSDVIVGASGYDLVSQVKAGHLYTWAQPPGWASIPPGASPAISTAPVSAARSLRRVT